jgi:hypothetical protein
LSALAFVLADTNAHPFLKGATRAGTAIRVSAQLKFTVSCAPYVNRRAHHYLVKFKLQEKKVENLSVFLEDEMRISRGFCVSWKGIAYHGPFS